MKIEKISLKTLGVILLLIFGLLLAISPAGLRKEGQVAPEALLASISSKTAYVYAEDIATWLIDKQPDLVLVDLRSSEEYQQYHIGDAINIPLATLFDDESIAKLNDDYTLVLYSNGDAFAAQAWVLLKQSGIESYILMGGMNYWAKAILNPEEPNDLASDTEVLRYQFRKSASAFFNTGGIGLNASGEKTTKKPPKSLKRRKKKVAEEGC